MAVVSQYLLDLMVDQFGCKVIERPRAAIRVEAPSRSRTTGKSKRSQDECFSNPGWERLRFAKKETKHHLVEEKMLPVTPIRLQEKYLMVNLIA